MAEPQKIPTPWKHQWRRVRYQLLPVLTLGLSILAVGYLWGRHAGLLAGTGEVIFADRDAVAQRDGILVQLPRTAIKLYEQVHAGQTVLARLDDRPVQAALAGLRNQITRLQLELPGKEQLIRNDHAARYTKGSDEAARAEEECRQATQAEFRRLQALDAKVSLATDRIELQRLNIQLDKLEDSDTNQGRQEFLSAQARRDGLMEVVRANEQSLAELTAQVESAFMRIKARPTVALADAQKILAPLQAEVGAIEAQVRDLEMQVESLQIVAPVSGQIVAIFKWPGQMIRAGESVCTIQEGAGGRHIVSYVRQDQRLRPTKGMTVDVRARVPGALTFATTIEDVGPRIELVPAHQLRDPRSPEWGIPVRIVLPTGMDVMPGELVDLRFWPNHNANGG